MTQSWQYDCDTGMVLCRCPDCGGRLVIGLFVYVNPYRYCPYCGIQLHEGKITAARKAVYGLEQEDEGRRVSLEVRDGNDI